MKSLSEIKKDIKKGLNRHIKEVSSVKTIGKALKYEIRFADILSEKKTESVLDNIKIFQKNSPGRYVYILNVNNKSNIKSVEARYTKAKGKDNNIDRAFARNNKTPGKSGVLYVGSSKNLRGRMRQHFGMGPDRTYALQMSYWCKGLKGSFILTVYTFDKDIETELLQTELFSKVVDC